VSKPKLTPWFSGDVKPARVGVYERIPTPETYPYAYWNGRVWMCSAITERDAKNHRDISSSHQHDKWRGLASNPKVSK